MSDPTSPPSLASLPTQLLTSAPAWFWRYASVIAISFLMVVGGDYYLGSPVAGYLRAVGEQRAKAVSLPTPTIDARMIQRIEALEKQAANRVQTFSDIEGRFALNESNFKALEAVTQYTIGRVSTVEKYLADPPKKKPVLVKSVPTVAVVPAPVTTAPVVHIGGEK